MKVQLLVSEWCQACTQAERVWQEVAERRQIDFAVVDIAQPEGRALARDLRLKTVPALVVDGELKAVGVQSPQQALALVAGAPDKPPSALRHVGMELGPTARVAIHSSLAYLFLAGAALPVYGGFLAEGPLRPLPLHMLTLGFLMFMVYGLGEHMLPRFTGNPIRLGAWAWTQLGLAHAGLWLFAAGLWYSLLPVTLTGGVLAWAALALFVLRLWRVLWPRSTPAAAGAARLTMTR